jgi:hypothetical protein
MLKEEEEQKQKFKIERKKNFSVKYHISLVLLNST